MKHEKPCLITFPNTEKEVDDMTCRELFLVSLEVIGNVVKHCVKCLIHVYLLN